MELEFPLLLSLQTFCTRDSNELGKAVSAQTKQSVLSEHGAAGHVTTTLRTDLLIVYIVGMNRRPTNRHQNELTVAACDCHLGGRARRYARTHRSELSINLALEIRGALW